MKFKITSEYGALEEIREGAAHTGIDLATPMHSELHSLHDGVIEKVLHLKDNVGNGVLIKFDDGTTGVYGHLSKILVEPGQRVAEGQLFAYTGASGTATGPHLHFGLKDTATGEFIDPTPVIEQVDAMAGAGGGLMDGFNKFSDWFVSKEMDYMEWAFNKQVEFFWKPIGAFAKHSMIDLGQWIITNLPDIMGYTTILAGVLIILGAMFGKGGVIKPIGAWAGLMIVAICLLV